MAHHLNSQKFKILNFNLKNIIFSYLNNLDYLHLYFTNLQIRSLLIKLNKEINKHSIQVFIFLLNLRNFKSFLNLQTDDYYSKVDNKHFLNYFEKCPLFSATTKKFSKFPYNHIVSGIVFYLNAYRDEYGFKNIKLNLNDNEELNHTKHIVSKLDKEKFIYCIVTDEIEKLKIQDSVLVSIYENLKYVKVLAMNKNFFSFLNKYNLELYFKWYNMNYLIPHEEKISIKIYFQNFPNHTEFLNWDEITRENSFDNLDLIKNNKESVRKINNLNSSFLEEFDNIFPLGLKNLRKITIVDKDLINCHSKIFASVKKLKFLDGVDSKLISMLKTRGDVESLEYVNKNVFKNLKCTESLKKVKIILQNTSTILQDLSKFKNLQKISLNFDYSSIFCQKIFSFDKFFELKNYKLINNLALSLLSKIITNNNEKIKNCCLISSEISDFHKFLDFLEQNNHQKVVKELKSIIINNPVDDKKIFRRKKYFNNLQYIEIGDSSLLPILNYTHTLDRIYINSSETEWKYYKLNYLKNKYLRMIKFRIIKADVLFDFIQKYFEHFKFLTYISIYRKYYENPLADKILKTVINLDPLFMNLRVLTDSKTNYRTTKTFRGIYGVEFG
jgi:hypothetical protein